MFLQFVILLYQDKHQIKCLKVSVISADSYKQYVFVDLFMLKILLQCTGLLKKLLINCIYNLGLHF